MPTYRKVLQQARQRLYEAGQGEQAAQLLMLELASLDAHNLYMEYDEEVPGELLERFEQGICRMEKGERFIADYELIKIAGILDVPVSFFFPGAEDK